MSAAASNAEAPDGGRSGARRAHGERSPRSVEVADHRPHVGRGGGHRHRSRRQGSRDGRAGAPPPAVHLAGHHLLPGLLPGPAHPGRGCVRPDGDQGVRPVHLRLPVRPLPVPDGLRGRLGVRPLGGPPDGPARRRPAREAPPAPDQGGGRVSHQTLSLTLFVVFVVLTLGITIWASRQTKTAADFYSAGRRITGWQNGVAISGDYMSAASFLGIAGLISLFGYDGFLYSVGWLVAYLTVLILVAELLRNSGKYTMADVLAYRMRQRPVRSAAALSTVGVSIVYLIAQMVGAGALVRLLLGLEGDAAAILAIVGVGVLMIVYVTFGGMIGTTWVQIVKAVLLMAGTVLLSFLVLAKFGFSMNKMFADAATASGKGEAFLAPGLRFTNTIELVSLGLALVLGTAGLPHILIRFYTVPTAQAARKSVIWAIGIIGSFYILTTFLGFGAAALVGATRIKEADAAGNMAGPLLAQTIGGGEGSFGGDLFLAFIAAVAFATILAVVAGLTITASSSFAHDFYANVLRRGQERDEAAEVRVARITALVIGAIAIVLASFARGQNVAFLFGLENPGIVSIPLGFAAAWLGTMLSREPASEEMYEELRVRALTGLGAEEAEVAPARATAPATRPTG